LRRIHVALLRVQRVIEFVSRAVGIASGVSPVFPQCLIRARIRPQPWKRKDSGSGGSARGVGSFNFIGTFGPNPDGCASVQDDQEPLPLCAE
jgi:hypothetical protein